LTEHSKSPVELEASAATAALLLAIDPVGLGGAVLRGRPGAARDAWIDLLKGGMPAESPLRRLPLNMTDERLLGGLDLAATLAAGRPVHERGVLAAAHEGLVVIPMAERTGAHRAAQIASVIDMGRVGQNSEPAQFATILLDEGEDEETAPRCLTDRVAFLLNTDGIPADVGGAETWRDDLAEARARLPVINVSDQAIETLTTAALAFGIDTLRAPLMAVRCARAAAALAGRQEVAVADITLAAVLVLGPRATQMPADPETPDAEPPPDEETDQNETPAEQQPDTLEDRVVDAVRVSLPDAIRAAMTGPAAKTKGKASSGRSEARQKSSQRGRPIGVRRGDPRSGQRLHLLETLRTAAPWQSLRRRQQPDGPPIRVRRDDFRVKRFENRVQNTTVFVVDASGSQAINRLAEAKGAIEYLLADSYVRRDQVALIAFRGKTAELLLPPTRSLVRAKRALARLPGGGATPLSMALDLASELAAQIKRRSASPALVLLTDGGANIARDGSPGRPAAERESLDAARQIAMLRLQALVIDTAPRASAFAASLAGAMSARYVALPYANAAMVSAAVQAARA
jgi:magnesium chelatase subunit D